MNKLLHRAAATLQQHWWHPRPSWLALALLPLAGLYLLLAGLNRLSWQLRKRPALPVPVVVVGNLIVGGAGKTPTTIALVQWLQSQGWQPGIVSRGYGRADAELRLVTAETPARLVGDEPLLMHLRTGAPVAVARDRVAAALALLAAHPAVNLIVSDDGLQHWRLQHDLSLIVFDGRGAGNRLLLPAGPLRQRLPRHLPPRSWVVYNADAPTTPLPGGCARRGLGGAVALSDWWQGAGGSMATLAHLRAKSEENPLLAAAGIASPSRFFDMLRAAGLRLRELPLPDHADLAALPWPTNEPDVLLTEKDAAKLPPGSTGNTCAWVVTLDFELPAMLTDALRSALASLIADHDR
ncbi:tetraacyldisaccharide 4'-kinase [Ideonella azotifigens]|uniref:Tetraacyldisaccharide 4'-kinase n=1 Tax=Ideonella azotifigens TaxID=513160 RepID=A0ABN1K928_9BURK|nr:tetraacyldisaccharide 4'-kinase [Ideonella azotifigens]MCD2342801.1 tetraacyldisaccharide 4'-kinase [Ideonella azotifigens]